MYDRLLVLVISLVVTLPRLLPAQQWVSRYNGPADSSDCAQAIAVDGRGNVYVTGRSFGVGVGEDYATVKYNSSGQQRWAARYNGPVGSYDAAYGVAVAGNGNVAVTGRSYGVGTYYDFATVLYDSLGAERWPARYNGPGNSYDEARGIVMDNQGSVYVTGSSYDATTSDDYTTIKYDSLGAQQWVARYNGPGNAVDVARAIAADAAGNVYVTGWSTGSGTDADYATVKYTPAGVRRWAARYNGPSNSTDEAYAIAIDRERNVYVTGVSYRTGTYYDYLTVKYDSAGNEKWTARYDGPTSSPDYAYALAVDAAGDVYVTGRSFDTNGRDYDYATVKYDTAGRQQWPARYNGPGNSYDEAYAVAVDNLGDVFVTGRSVGTAGDEDYATVKYNAAGAQQWVNRYDGLGRSNDIANAVAVDNSGYVYVTGESFGSGTERDYATIKYASTSTTEEPSPGIGGKSRRQPASIITGAVPRPAGRRWRVLDITGREVDASPLRPGVYFIEIDGRVAHRVIKIQ